MVNSMELSVGMYVRFDEIIRKIVDIDEDDYIEFDEEFGDCFGEKTFSEKRETFIKFYEPEKSSFNIIDLIKVGDYVNGHEVKSKQSGVRRIDIGEDENYVWLYGKDIKTIITHAQMKQMEYKVK